MIVLGLDVSSSSTGWSILKHGRFYNREGKDYGIIVPSKKLKPAEKLDYFRSHLCKVLRSVPDKVVIGIEDTFLRRNVNTLKILSRFAGVAMQSCWEVCGVEPIIVPVKELRTVWGTQDKEEIFNLVVEKYSLNDWEFKLHNDITDSIAIAFYLNSISKE